MFVFKPLSPVFPNSMKTTISSPITQVTNPGTFLGSSAFFLFYLLYKPVEILLVVPSNENPNLTTSNPLHQEPVLNMLTLSWFNSISSKWSLCFQSYFTEVCSSQCNKSNPFKTKYISLLTFSWPSKSLAHMSCPMIFSLFSVALKLISLTLLLIHLAPATLVFLFFENAKHDDWNPKTFCS